MCHLRKASRLINGQGCVTNVIKLKSSHNGIPGPKMTAFQSMMLSGHGLPEIPEGGSVESLLKSRIRRLLQFVDCQGHVSALELTRESEYANHRERSCAMGALAEEEVVVAERDWPL